MFLTIIRWNSNASADCREETVFELLNTHDATPLSLRNRTRAYSASHHFKILGSPHQKEHLPPSSSLPPTLCLPGGSASPPMTSVPPNPSSRLVRAQLSPMPHKINHLATIKQLYLESPTKVEFPRSTFFQGALLIWQVSSKASESPALRKCDGLLAPILVLVDQQRRSLKR